jgi:hypothetical protein
MATRVQTLLFALGIPSQANITTAAASFIHLDKLNATITSPNPTFESDASYIGKGGPTPEWATIAAPVAFNVKGSIEKYGSAEFLTWMCAYALGTVTYASTTYTITPLDTRTSLELPYFSLVEQITESGSSAVNNLYLGNTLDSFDITFNSGPGRQSLKATAAFVGSGNVTTPSGVTVPAITPDHYMVSQSATSLSINGINYLTAKSIINGSWKWSNALASKNGFFPGSGVVAVGAGEAAVMGRIEVGDRSSSFEFTARMLSAGTEYTKLLAGTTGSVVLTFYLDATHNFTITMNSVQFTSVENTSVDGLAAVKVMCTLLSDPTFTTPLVTVTAECGIVGIA